MYNQYYCYVYLSTHHQAIFPPARSKLVPRPRLVERITSGLSDPHTLISPPAGNGKTSLLSEWRAFEARQSFPIACLSLDPDDSELGHSLAYLINAIQMFNPGFGEITLASL
ncbi:MAG: hypothetical protein A2032_01715 [Chloroflexi bacterium RBG_19FT_COMBO_49_13]|nr:MAG: hypothetical protein A2032_01715 [Chloroflexi bacterium RBG_19FT_COMBO_49_13]